MRWTRWAATLGLVLVALAGCRQASPVAMSEHRRQLHLQSFDQVWETVRKQHWDKDLNGVDWEAARNELRPKVQSAATDAQARAVMTELIGRLKQSHFAIIPAEAYARLDELPGSRDSGESTTAPSAQAGVSGVHLRVVGDDVVVTRVEPGSAGEKAGVRPGWLLQRVGKTPVDRVLRDVRKAYGSSNLLRAYEILTMNSLLEGDIGKTLDARFLDGKNRSVRAAITLEKPAGTPAKFMNLPTFYVQTEARRIEPDVGYIFVSAFFGTETVPKFRAAVESFRDADGLILDLRGNPGGIGFMANGMAGYLVDQPGLQLGQMTMRDAKLDFRINPQPFVFTGPLAVLVDGASMSTSEILAGGLQDIGRARVFGTPTPGAALPSRIERLPNGDGFQYAFANYVSARGQALEGRGVQPDEVVWPERRALLAGRDPVIDAAVAWIVNQARLKVGRL
ncbi:MAG: S41 family peptidase [Phycisphaerae bacterium]|nr:S41 family peptidase [Phycisphaerae bacterium]MDW8261052.1 S41 family peptidase [Phycisphaerales bacterium]